MDRLHVSTTNHPRHRETSLPRAAQEDEFAPVLSDAPRRDQLSVLSFNGQILARSLLRRTQSDAHKHLRGRATVFCLTSLCSATPKLASWDQRECAQLLEEAAGIADGISLLPRPFFFGAHPPSDSEHILHHVALLTHRSAECSCRLAQDEYRQRLVLECSQEDLGRDAEAKVVHSRIVGWSR